MRGERQTVGGSALLAAVLLGAPGCADAVPLGEPVAACARPVPSASETRGGGASAGGGLAETCGIGGVFSPSGGDAVALVALMVLFSPLLLTFAVVGAPLRVLGRLNRGRT